MNLDLYEKFYNDILEKVNSVVRIGGAIERLEKTSKRRWWVKPHFSEYERKRHGAYNKLFLIFKATDHEEFYKFVRMTPAQFSYLLSLIENDLKSFSKRKLEENLLYQKKSWQFT